MTRSCKIIVALFATAYGVALMLLAVGTYGLFGSDSGPLAGVFLLPLGLPWTMLSGGASDGLRPWLAAGSPALNLLGLLLLCRWRARRSVRD